jgi:hypothetical protein
MRLGIATNSQQRKQFERRIHWLEGYRNRRSAE